MSDHAPSEQGAGYLGPVDRTVRTLIGLAMLPAVFEGPAGWWGVIGLLPLMTALDGYCPLYEFLGISSVGGPHRVAHV